MFTGFCLLLVGYSGIRIIYDTGSGSSTSGSISTATFPLLVLFSWMTGVGASGGVAASLNVTAKSFPDSLRGSTVGIVSSALGLSAFVFSFIARTLPMLFGFFFVRPIPLEAPPQMIPSEPNTQTPLLMESGSRQRCSSTFRRPLERIHGRKLISSLDFWLLFCISSLGLMYINNVGSMARILYIHENYPKHDETEVSRLQAAQVSTISLASFLGRIFIGIVSDFLKAHFGLPRSYLLFLATTTTSSLPDCRFPAHFSEILGFLAFSPLIGGNIFSVAFGKNLDAHESPVTAQILSLLVGETNPRSECREGRVCYVETLYLTIIGCALSVLLGVWAGWRDHRRIDAPLIVDEEGREVGRARTSVE
ncbi:hypothetical protein BT96DRAFT_991664 [Gymnopus androsaceus JB14]|uniref:MFS general substrate transporter n=1 Tax=Gymnopus androsaceus JB14 TaxID=1447944 RepID=A0A6A4HTS5_9AGAR|nr:hypothetical protein BT96DRAFT_991664 [Gymnopus androsaceus JB14]